MSYKFIEHHRVQQENRPMLIRKALYIAALSYLNQFKFLSTLSRFLFYFSFLFVYFILLIYHQNHNHLYPAVISIWCFEIFNLRFSTFLSPYTQQFIMYLNMSYFLKLRIYLIILKYVSRTDRRYILRAWNLFEFKFVN